ncbi:MAG: Choline-binding protein [Chlamydiia bacterium]|nr:Choline-binding protein [Chlamydiia bacterium]
MCIARASFYSCDLVIGAKLDDENQFMAEIIAQIIEKNTKLKVKRLFNLEGTLISFFSVLSGSIDCYVEYTGSGFLEILKRDYPDELNKVSMLDELLYVEHSCRFIPILGFNSSYALLGRKEVLKRNSIETISDFVDYSYKDPKLKIAVDPEFYSRPEYKNLIEKYGLNPALKSTIMDASLLYLSASKDAFYAVSGHTLDPRIEKYNLQVLEDDKKIFPKYEPGIICKKELLKKHPYLEDIFSQLYMKISDSSIRSINKEIAKGDLKLRVLAEAFLEEMNYFEKEMF